MRARQTDMKATVIVPPATVLVIGATGSIGRKVVDEALKRGYRVRAMVRDPARAREFPSGVQRILGDLTRSETLTEAVAGIDAIVFTHGSDGGGKTGARTIDYGGVRNVLQVLDGRTVRVALMTAIGVTNRESAYNRSTESHDWKRRAERLVRASGLPYTIVRPGWFDYNAPDQHRLVFLQGDTRHAGDPSDGVVSRQQIAQVLVRSLGSGPACRKTLELVAERGPNTTDFDALFAKLQPDAVNALDAACDTSNMPLTDEPVSVCEDLARCAARGRVSPADFSE